MYVIGSAILNDLVAAEYDFSYLILIFTTPSLPSLVVTNITPLAPLAPNKEVAVASFMTEKLEISSGCSLAKSVEVVSIPSIKISGDLAYPKVLTPLIKNSALSRPGSPLL